MLSLSGIVWIPRSQCHVQSDEDLPGTTTLQNACLGFVGRARFRTEDISLQVAVPTDGEGSAKNASHEEVRQEQLRAQIEATMLVDDLGEAPIGPDRFVRMVSTPRAFQITFWLTDHPWLLQDLLELEGKGKRIYSWKQNRY